VGRLEKEKGVHVLLEAMCQVQEAIPSVRLLVAGDGSYRRELEVRADRLGLRNHVSFLGWIEAADLRVAYEEAWVLVLPSIWAEGLGMVLVEAGLMRRPVIGSDLGGIRDIIQHGHNGLLVPPGDSKALAEAILTILTNRNLAQQMGLANLEMARKYLSQRDKALEQVHRAILDLVEKQ
jgi:glycosyltransferase involved in cell wall biosynthesis